MANPDISIIIVTWNTAKITLKCIQTIDKYLNNKLNYEIIVVDNASSDNTKSVIASEAKQSRWNNLVLIANKENSGFAKGNNLGVKQANGEYLLFLNSDMELIDNSIVDLFKYYKNNENIGIIGPKFLNPDLTPQGSVFPPQTIVNAFKEYFLNIPNAYSKYSPKINKPISIWSISGGAMLIKKDLFLKAGAWNEKYFMYFEDLDLCRAIRKLKKLIVYYPDCKVIHRHGASGTKIASAENQWKRLIPGSIKYHGKINHYLINFILKLGQKWQKIIS
jgi:GT2 family glycosyltransferase